MVLQKLLRAGEGRKLKQLQKLVVEVNAHADLVKELSDDALRAKTDEFKARLAGSASGAASDAGAAGGQTLDDLLPEAFAVVREAAWRVLGQRPYDVQVLGGAALHAGAIAEMRTGEGKTLTATLPIYLNALAGEGVHVVTANPYLASRDAAWMGRVYGFLGLSTGLVHAQQSKRDKREAYASDITYGTANEFGFDFLRDHMALAAEDRAQRGHHFCIVDEVDSILVDEARTPLIISGPSDQSSEWYTVFAKRVVPRLQPEVHYEVDEGKRTIAVTEEGVAKVEELLGVGNLYESVNTPLIHHLQNAIRAKELFRRDVEYIVEDGEVHIVDEFTGRILYGRRYSEGLHQAIEAKEGVRIKEENQTLATITLQNYFRSYEKLAGMTGTAKTEEAEFAHIYKMDVVQIPTHRPTVRVDHPDLVYKTEKAKFEAVAEDIAERQAKGQPVLVGTVSVEKSEKLSAMLTRRGVRHEVLNAKNHFKEAEIIAQAGRIGSVTVATNMAGRGVDIMLGGNAESLATVEAKKVADPDQDPEAFQRAYDEHLARFKDQVKAEGDKVRELGGLYVLGTERHESRRIDNQLRGRSGRQGDPGESRFYLSLEDDLMRLFNAAAVESIMTRLKLPEDMPIEHKMVTNAVARAQAQVESRNFEIRKNVLKYDDVMNNQRQVIYAQRDLVLDGEDEQIEEIAESFVEEAITGLVETYAPEGVYPEEWNLEELWTALETIYPVKVDRGALALDKMKREELAELLVEDAFARYEEREREVGAETLRQVEHRVILSVVDRIWREHLYEMDHLREGIGLRAVGQRDPLVEYQREAYEAFVGMMARIKEEAAGYFFNVPVQKAVATPAPAVDEDGEASLDASPGAGSPGAASPGAGSPGAASPGAGSPGAAPMGAGSLGAGSLGAGSLGAGSLGAAATASTSPASEPAAPKPEIARPALDRPAGVNPQRLSYTSAENAGSVPGDGSGSYSVGAGPAGAAAVGSAKASAELGAAQRLQATAHSEKVGRNDPCPCGSGQKYKRCHGA